MLFEGAVLAAAVAAGVVGVAEVLVYTPNGIADGKEQDGCNDDVLVHGILVSGE